MEKLGDILKRSDLLQRYKPELVGTEPKMLQEEINLRREAVWHRACIAGRCRFAELPKHVNELPPGIDANEVCGGYHGTRSILRRDDPNFAYAGTDPADTERVVWRWRPCARQLAWDKHMAELVRAEREKFGKAKKGPAKPDPEGW